MSLCFANGTEYERSYEIERRKIADLLKGYYVSIEHVGSTAIPNLLAKPIIDIAVGIQDFANIDCLTSILEDNGYIYLANHGELSRRIFIKANGNIITHHIHIEEFGKQNWLNHVLFRDRLLASKDLRNDYMNLKIQLLTKYAQDREKYTSGKADFIQRVLREQKHSID